jgi:integrase
VLPQEIEQINQFLEQWQDQTRRDYFKVLLGFYKFAEKEFDVNNIMTSISKPRVRKKESAFLTKAEAVKLFSKNHSNGIMLH